MLQAPRRMGGPSGPGAAPEGLAGAQALRGAEGHGGGGAKRGGPGGGGAGEAEDQVGHSKHMMLWAVWEVKSGWEVHFLAVSNTVIIVFNWRNTKVLKTRGEKHAEPDSECCIRGPETGKGREVY